MSGMLAFWATDNKILPCLRTGQHVYKIITIAQVLASLSHLSYLHRQLVLEYNLWSSVDICKLFESCVWVVLPPIHKPLVYKKVPILCSFVFVCIVNKTDCKFKFLISDHISFIITTVEVLRFLRSTPHGFQIHFVSLLAFWTEDSKFVQHIISVIWTALHERC